MTGTQSLLPGYEFTNPPKYDDSRPEARKAASVSKRNKNSPLDRLSYLSTLGRGSQGSVYLVHDHRTNERLALKAILVPQDLSSDDICAIMLERNALIHAQEHNVSGVIKVKEMFEDSGVCYILMQLGHTSLRDEFKVWKREMPVFRIRSIVYDIACALKDMHAVSMIHRDVKPDNVFLDGKGHAWLTDLGMAHHGPRFTRGAWGTYEYMAPEVKCGLKYDGKADVWSLGVLLYKLIFDKVSPSRSLCFSVLTF
jgi:serine/threonine protein kinase